ncbi:MAG: hypothetical protein ACYC9O_18315 [Candidatus Latescibacterota bacterium]
MPFITIRKAVRFFLLFFLVLSLPCRGELRPKPPVFFSYAWPIGPESPRDFLSIDMEVINAIDIGPDSLSYAASIRKSYDRAVFDLWHRQGKVLIRRCYDRKFGPDGKKVEVTPVGELLEMWSHALDEPGVDGIAVDEFIKDDPERIAIWTGALERIRKKYPDKLIFCWIAGKGLNPAAAPLHRAIRDFSDYCLPEIYYRESAAKGFPDFAFTRFDEALNKLEENAPGIAAKIILGIGVHETLFNDDPAVDYMEFVEAQIRYIVRNPALATLPGLAFYSPMKLSQENIRRLNGMILTYYRDKISGGER